MKNINLYSISGGAARNNNIICIIIVFNIFVYSCHVKYVVYIVTFSAEKVAIYIPNC